MTSDPSRSQIRNSISRTLFGHLMDGDWVHTFLVGHYTYFSILVFWEILKWIRFWSQVPGFTGPGRGNMGWCGLSCGVTINFGSEPLIIVSRPTWTFLQSQNFSSAVQCEPSQWSIFSFSSLFIIASCDLAQENDRIIRGLLLAAAPASSPPHLWVICRGWCSAGCFNPQVVVIRGCFQFCPIDGAPSLC